MMKTNYFEDGRLEVGVDEVGRGCLAGPVYAAAVVMSHEVFDMAVREGVKIGDSKKLSPRQRTISSKFIMAHAEAWGVSSVDVETIDCINIRNASFMAMRKYLPTSLWTVIVFPHISAPHTFVSWGAIQRSHL